MSSIKSFKYRLWQTDKPLLSKYDGWRKQSELLALSKQAKTKLEWFIYYHTKGNKSVAVITRYFGVSKSTFYKWFSVFDPSNLKSLEESSRAPHKRKMV
jgi:hypothetical protein